MGGKAIGTERISREKYENICSAISNHIKSKYPEVSLHIPRTLPSKLDFGDVDILIYTEQAFEPEKDDFFASLKTIRNGFVHSIEYKGAQVDFLICNSLQVFELSKIWFDYGDLGMILGIICKKFRLKWSNSGLFLRQDDSTSCEIALSSNWLKVFGFLGLDKDVFTAGFNSEEDIAEWISKSKLFQSNFFAAADITHDEKRRTSTRPMYTKLKTMLAALPSQPEVSADDVRDQALEFFDKKDEYYALLKDLEDSRELKKKFNGKVVGRLTGLKGKELGTFMNSTAPIINPNMSENEIERLILSKFQGMELK